MTKTKNDHRPGTCRLRLKDENKPYPRSSCKACGATAATGMHCPYTGMRPATYNGHELRVTTEPAILLQALADTMNHSAELAAKQQRLDALVRDYTRGRSFTTGALVFLSATFGIGLGTGAALFWILWI